MRRSTGKGMTINETRAWGEGGGGETVRGVGSINTHALMGAFSPNVSNQLKAPQGFEACSHLGHVI